MFISPLSYSENDEVWYMHKDKWYTGTLIDEPYEDNGEVKVLIKDNHQNIITLIWINEIDFNNGWPFWDTIQK